MTRMRELAHEAAYANQEHSGWVTAGNCFNGVVSSVVERAAVDRVTRVRFPATPLIAVAIFAAGFLAGRV